MPTRRLSPLKSLLTATLLAAIVLLGLPKPARAGPTDDACAALAQARASLVRMLTVQDPRDVLELRAQVNYHSAVLDSVLGQMSASDPMRVAAFRIPWEAFKMTRERIIIPTILLGARDDATILAMGVQAQRLREMYAIMGCQP
ncbi:MAG TPA: hypothetical protein PLW81_12995 [Thiobacillaceae bacterium]|nr:hypothetical protein [Thiobacillaceae bacterium]